MRKLMFIGALLVIFQGGCTELGGTGEELDTTRGDVAAEQGLLAGSCVGSCGGQSPDGCWCDEYCSGYGDCCTDYDAVCNGTPEPDPNSCEGYCGQRAPGGCWCDTACSSYGNCCADYEALCVTDPDPDPDPDPNPTDPWASLSEGALVSALQSYTATGHVGMSYTNARNQMYGVSGGIGLDIHNGLIECIYTGITAAPDGTRTPGGVINTEHSWPQSQGADVFPRQGDIHHLFPSQMDANSRRSSYDFGETVCSGSGCTWSLGGSELGSDSAGKTVFQVRQKYRGDIARAHFYFSVRYGLAIPNDEEATLQAWNDQDPPDQEEIDRNTAIESVQGNRNPFVDYPGLSDRISNF